MAKRNSNSVRSARTQQDLEVIVRCLLPCPAERLLDVISMPLVRVCRQCLGSDSPSHLDCGAGGDSVGDLRNKLGLRSPFLDWGSPVGKPRQAMRHGRNGEKGQDKSDLKSNEYVRMAPPRPVSTLRGCGHHIPKRPFSNACSVQQHRTLVRAGRTAARHRVQPVQAKAEDVGDAEERQVCLHGSQESSKSPILE